MASFQRRPLPTGGLVSSTPSDLLEADKSPALRNVRFRFDAVFPRPGRESFGTIVDDRPRNISRFSKNDTVKWLVMLTDSALWRWGDTGPGTPKNWYKCAGPVLGGSSRWSTAVGEDRFFFTRWGSNGIWYWDGVPANPIQKLNTGTLIQECSYIEYFNHRLLAADIFDTDKRWANRVRWPINGNSDIWTGDGSGNLDFYEPEQEPIQGLRVLGNRCVVFREHSLTDMVATGTLEPVFISEQRTINVGTMFPYSIASNGIAIFFLGNDGNVWAWNGSQLTPVGAPIYRTLQQVVNVAGGPEYFGFVYPYMNEYWLWLARDQILIFDFIKGRWMADDFPDLAALGDTQQPLGASSWDTTTGHWSAFNVNWMQMRPRMASRMIAAKESRITVSIGEDIIGSEDGSEIDCSIETPDQYFETGLGPFSMGTIEQLMLVYEFNGDPAPFEIGISTDRGFTWNTQLIAANQRGYAITSWKITGNVWRLRVRTLTNQPKFRWIHYVFEYVPGGTYAGLNNVF